MVNRTLKLLLSILFFIPSMEGRCQDRLEIISVKQNNWLTTTRLTSRMSFNLQFTSDGKTIVPPKDYLYSLTENNVQLPIDEIIQSDSNAHSICLILFDAGEYSDPAVLQFQKNQALQFIGQATAFDRIALAVYDSTIRFIANPGTPIDTLKSRLAGIKPGKGSVVFDAIDQGVQSLATEIGKRCLIVFSAHPDDGSNQDADTLEKRIYESDVFVYAFSLGTNDTTELSLRRIAFLSDGEYVRSADTNHYSSKLETIAHEIFSHSVILRTTIFNCFDSLRTYSIEAKSSKQTTTADTSLAVFFSHRQLNFAFDAPEYIEQGKTFEIVVKSVDIPHSFIAKKIRLQIHFDYNTVMPISVEAIGLLQAQHLDTSYLNSSDPPALSLVVNGTNIFFDTSMSSRDLFRVRFSSAADWYPPNTISTYISMLYLQQDKDLRGCFDLNPEFAFTNGRELKFCDCERTAKPRLIPERVEASGGEATFGLYLDTEFDSLRAKNAYFFFQSINPNIDSIKLEYTGTQFEFMRLYLPHLPKTYYAVGTQDFMRAIDRNKPMFSIRVFYNPKKEITLSSIYLRNFEILQRCCYIDSFIILPLPLDGYCELVIKKNRKALPSQFFPNPGKDLSTLRYELSSTSATRVLIKNLRGEELMCLRDDVDEAGKKTVSVPLNTLPSGSYFYEIETRDLSSGERKTVSHRFEVIR